VTLPDPDLKWNEERQHYDYGQIDWDESGTRSTATAPATGTPGDRVKAHNDGQWVRDAALAYAQKHQPNTHKEAA